MREGDRVMAPDPTDEESEEFVVATYVRLVALSGVAGQMTHKLHRVRYDDGTEENWPEGLISPVNESS